MRLTETRKQWTHDDTRDVLDRPHACFCIGPQNGESLCPCRMRQQHRERQKMRQEILEELGIKQK
jgi:hypothetical protein